MRPAAQRRRAVGGKRDSDQHRGQKRLEGWKQSILETCLATKEETTGRLEEGRELENKNLCLTREI